MALSQEEIQIAEFGRKNGKSEQQVMEAISKFRSDSQQKAKEPNYRERVSEDYVKAGERIKSGIETGAQGFQQGLDQSVTGKTFLDRTKGILKGTGLLLRSGLRTAGSVASAASAPVVEAPVINEGLEKVGEGIANLPGADKVMLALNSFKEKYPEAAKDAEDIFNLLTLGAGKTVEKPIVSAIETTTKKGITLADDAGGAVMKATRNVAGDIIPQTDNFINEQVTKALDLTQGDVSNIASSTGNEVGRFLADNQLIGATKKETQKLINDFYKTNYDIVRSEISKVTKAYSPSSIPRYTEALKQIKKAVNNVAGLQDTAVEVENLLNKGLKGEKISLSEVQRVKELMDEHFSLYKATGDVKESVTKEGLANIRKDIKEFIEKEVKTNTGVDISDLNNKVATARSIDDAVKTRTTRGLTTSNIKMGDLGIFGIGFGTGGPLFGAALLFGKKIIESPTARLRIAKYLDTLSDARKAKVKAQLEAGKIPDDLNKFVKKKP